MPHVAEILALPGFTGARILEVLEPAPPSRRIALCVQYTLADAAALDGYLREHAPRLRAEGVARFGDRFRAQRRDPARSRQRLKHHCFQAQLQPCRAVARVRLPAARAATHLAAAAATRCASTARSSRSAGVIVRSTASSGSRCAAGTCASNGCRRM